MTPDLLLLLRVCRRLCAPLIAVIILAQAVVAQEKTRSAPNVAASIQGVAITQDELNKAAAADLEKLDIQRLQFEAQLAQARQQVLETTLRRMIQDKVLSAEAARLSITKEELISREVASKVKEPTQQEIDDYYETNKARIGANKEWVSDQIKQYLRQQSQARAMEAFVESLKKPYAVISNLGPLRYQIETKGHPAKGPESAPVTIVEFSDFQCSYCQTVASTLQRIASDYGGKVRIVYRHFPNPNIHPFAQKAAEASLCAHEQGKFWEMHDLMFQDPNHLSVDDLKAKAAKIGLGKDAFESCLASDRYATRVKQDFLDATRAGVGGTPALFINGRLIAGARPYEEIAATIDEELKNKYPTPPAKP